MTKTGRAQSLFLLFLVSRGALGHTLPPLTTCAAMTGQRKEKSLARMPIAISGLGVQTLGSTRFPGIMTSLVTSTNLVPLESFTNCHMTSETLTGNRRGTKEKRRIMGIGTFVIDRPFDKHLKFRKNLQDFQEQHRGVAKSQVKQLPVPFRLSNLKKDESAGETRIGELLPLLRRVSTGHLRDRKSSSPSPSSSDSVEVKKEDEGQVKSDGCLPPLTVATCKLATNGLQKRGAVHEKRKNQAVDRCMENGSPSTPREVSETERLPRLQTLNKLSLHRETTRFKTAFESSGPSSKHHVMATKTKLLGDLIQAGKMARPYPATPTSQLDPGYNKRYRLPPVGVERRAPVESPPVLEMEWIDLVNIQLVDYDDYDRYASRRLPSVSRGNRCNCLQPYATLGQERNDEVGQKLNKGAGQGLDEGVGQELDEGVGQELKEREGQALDEGVGQELDEREGQALAEGVGQELDEGGQELGERVVQKLDEEENPREMVQSSFGKYSSKS
ncbi:uncharacterized protein LOC112561818 isoform X2 [Pomacea canaliculata]|nr:uncharacterized protein LOC112561818 isoform X2 [Pomacea canaliculata]XP_025090352.1 uncharacterized protein LOC112561818 isoform X2 [Pomacea canaliculata]